MHLSLFLASDWHISCHMHDYIFSMVDHHQQLQKEYNISIVVTESLCSFLTSLFLPSSILQLALFCSTFPVARSARCRLVSISIFLAEHFESLCSLFTCLDCLNLSCFVLHRYGILNNLAFWISIFLTSTNNYANISEKTYWIWRRLLVGYTRSDLSYSLFWIFSTLGNILLVQNMHTYN